MKRSAWLVVVFAALMLPAGADAAFPGKNGRIAFVSVDHLNCCNFGIYTMEPDGSDLVRLTQDLSDNTDPAWSPDGQRIAFASTRDNPGEAQHIWIMDADGSNPVQVTDNPNRSDLEPAWSPDGSKIVFDGLTTSSPNDIYTVDVDGSDETNLTASPPDVADAEPAWSPDGQKIAFSSARDGVAATDLYTMAPDGSQVTRLTQTADWEIQPNWSPDGAKLVFFRGAASQPADQNDLYLMNGDGTGTVQVTNDPDDNTDPVWAPAGDRIAYTNSPNGSGSELHLIDPDGGNEIDVTPGFQPAHKSDWQPIPINFYPRPKGATPFRASLALAYKQCTAPDRTHGPPLAFPSCAGPQKSSARLTVGTGDSNGLPARNEGYLRLETVVGAPGGPDDADVNLALFMDDVLTNALADYGGEIRAHVSLRITDKDNTPHPGGPGAATTTEIPLDVIAPCIGVASPQDGSVCSVSTTADALVPGTVKESRRSVWQLGRAEVYDGGPDGDANTPSGDTLFATQGIFIP